MTLKDAMGAATYEILAEKVLQTTEQINERDCFNWAFKVFNTMPGTYIGGHRIDGEGQSYIIYEGKCYDAETPEGVANWWELESFKRMLGMGV